MGIDYREIEDGELVKWDTEGMVVEGVLASYEEKDTSNGIGHVYEVETKEETLTFFAPTLLHKKLQKVAVGSVVKIEFTEVTQTAAKNDLKHFKVQSAEPNEANFKAVGMEHKIQEIS